MAIDTTIPVWPRWFAPETLRRGRKRPVMLGPQPLSGSPQAVSSGFGHWAPSFEKIPVHDYLGRALIFDSLMYRLTTLQPIIIPMMMYKRTPRARAGMARSWIATLLADAPTITDPAVDTSRTVDFKTSGTAAIGAMSIVVALQTAGLILEPGQIFGIDDRVYGIQTVAYNTPTSGKTTLTFWPPLRYATTDAYAIETEDPVLRCILDPADVEVASALEFDIIDHPTLHFVESNWT